MKLSKPILSLLLSSALWMPVAFAQQPENNTGTSPQSTTGTPSNPGAVQPQPVVPPVDAKSGAPDSKSSTDAGANATTSGTAPNAGAAGSNASAASSTSVDMSGWTGKTVKGSDGKKLGTVSAAAGDKVTVDTKWGSVELASSLVAADESGDLKASTTSSLDARAMAKSQKGDMAGAAAVSKKRLVRKPKPAAPAEGTTGTEQAPAGETPSGATPEQPPAEQNPQQPPASADQPPANKPPAEQQTPATPQTPQQ